LQELLADRALGGLTPNESLELDSLLEESPGTDEQEFDRLVALLEPYNQLSEPPTRLLLDLFEQAQVHFQSDPLPVPATPTLPKRRRSNYWSELGWVCALALLAALAYLNWPQPATTPLSLAQKREILATEPRLTQAFQSAPNAAQSGNVIWSTSKQEGYLEVRGLKPNQPSEKQYQLWIVDQGRTGQPPVDGGLFDVDSEGNALVAIRSPIPVRQPVLFAVTEEPSGGVVVSESGKRGEFVVVMAPRD
jgi:anti-sigma-K factor RskA